MPAPLAPCRALLVVAGLALLLPACRGWRLDGSRPHIPTPTPGVSAPPATTAPAPPPAARAGSRGARKPEPSHWLFELPTGSEEGLRAGRLLDAAGIRHGGGVAHGMRAFVIAARDRDRAVAALSADPVLASELSTLDLLR
jgi:hypothetical protein